MNGYKKTSLGFWGISFSQNDIEATLEIESEAIDTGRHPMLK